LRSMFVAAVLAVVDAASALAALDHTA
jgi:hypothetical protein